MKASAYIWNFIINEVLYYSNDKEGKSFLKLINYSDYIDTPKNEIYSDTIEEMAESLSLVDLTKNIKLKKVFFDNFKKVADYNKRRCFNEDDFFSNKESKLFFLKEMIKNPDLYELNFFRKKLSTEDLNTGLLNYIKSITKNNSATQWEDIVGIPNTNKLLLLFKLSTLTKEDMNMFSHISFREKYKELEFNNIFNLDVETENIIDVSPESFYNIHIKLKEIEIKKIFPQYSQYRIGNICSFLNAMFEECLESKKLEINSEESIYITSNEEVYKKDKKNTALLTKDLSSMIPIILENYFENKVIKTSDINKFAKEFGNKIMLKETLEELPQNKNKIMRKI